MREVLVGFADGVPLSPAQDRSMTAQLAWVRGYNGYDRLASDPGQLEALLAGVRQAYRRSGRVPEWCGVDLLKGWAFYLYRYDYFSSGGHALSRSDAALFREWNDVMAALAAHPAAGLDDRPPTARPAPRRFADQPRMHRDPEFLAAKRARLWEPQVAPINSLVDAITRTGKGDVPYVDPDSGGVSARVLLLLEAPARAAAHGSGMLSADNDDATAAHVWEGYGDSGLPREWGVHWNAVPWYVGKKEKIRAVTAAEIVEGRRWLHDMIELLPNLRVVLTLGAAARKSVAPLTAELEQRRIAVISTWHPSPRNFNSRPQSRPELMAAFAEANRIASESRVGRVRDSEGQTDFEALDGLSVADRDDLQALVAWRDPWPGHVRPCTDELRQVERIRASGQPVFPARGLETAALCLLPFSDVRVVLLGIDPYPNAKHATGLAFSVPSTTTSLPRAARNLRALVARDYGEPDGGSVPTGDLSAWVRQGVLLLNRALTYSPDPTKKSSTGAHLPIWRDWTNAVITALDQRANPPVFLLMGNDAQAVERRGLIRHGAVVKTRHPAARLKVHEEEFLSSRALRKVNRLVHGDPIDWTL